MKKYLTMCIAMFCMAFASVVLTSCGSDDEPTATVKVVSTASIYDPNHELTAEQTATLQAGLDKVGKFERTFNNEEELKKALSAWSLSVSDVIIGMMIEDETLGDVRTAGVKLSSSVNGLQRSETITFAEFKSDGELGDKDPDGYNVVGKIQVYDPNNELTPALKTELQKQIATVGFLDIKNAQTLRDVETQYVSWLQKGENALVEILKENPEIMRTKAGMKVVLSGVLEDSSDTYLFSEFKEFMEN